MHKATCGARSVSEATYDFTVVDRLTDERRYERERGFHDAKYGDGDDSTTDKYYVVLRSCYSVYTSTVERDCAGKDILEYGCGTGSHSYALARAGATVTGIDISTVAIEEARADARAEGLTGTRFVDMNAENLTFPDDSFDRICGASILHHLDLDVACAGIARCLRPGGDAVFVEPLGHNPLVNLYRRATPGLRTPDEHPLRRDDFQTFERHFEQVDIHFFGLAALAAFPSGVAAGSMPRSVVSSVSTPGSSGGCRRWGATPGSR